MGFVMFSLLICCLDNVTTISLGAKIYNCRAHSDIPTQEAQLRLGGTGD